MRVPLNFGNTSGIDTLYASLFLKLGPKIMEIEHFLNVCVLDPRREVHPCSKTHPAEPLLCSNTR